MKNFTKLCHFTNCTARVVIHYTKKFTKEEKSRGRVFSWGDLMAPFFIQISLCDERLQSLGFFLAWLSLKEVTL
jgi:hypothetical protein